MKGQSEKLQDKEICKNVNSSSLQQDKEDCMRKIVDLACYKETECTENLFRYLGLEGKSENMIDGEDIMPVEHTYNNFWEDLESNGIRVDARDLQNRINAVSDFYKSVNNFNKDCELFKPDSVLENDFEELLIKKGVLELLFENFNVFLRKIFNRGVVYSWCKTSNRSNLYKIHYFYVPDPHKRIDVKRKMEYFRVKYSTIFGHSKKNNETLIPYPDIYPIIKR